MSDPSTGRDPASGAGGPGSVADEPLSQVVDDIDERNDGGQFMSLEGGSIRCLTCRSEMPASDVPAVNVRRLEGESDPADMSMTVPVTCSECATTGSLVVQYGPEAGVADADVLAAMPRPPDAGR
jgi:hypothetical protein